MAERASKASKSKYLEFELIYDTGKTKRIAVLSRKSRIVLGNIYWFWGWRSYALFPSGEVAFNSECLRAIAAYMDDLMSQWRSEHGRH